MKNNSSFKSMYGTSQKENEFKIHRVKREIYGIGTEATTKQATVRVYTGAGTCV